MDFLHYSILTISTHTPLAGRDVRHILLYYNQTISTHTPLAGRDKGDIDVYSYGETFLLTRPLRGATWITDSCDFIINISTHTPLAGRDADFDKDFRAEINFYSHAPCGARRDESRVCWSRKISTHTPLAGRDKRAGTNFANGQHFYSHAPCGARLGY